MECLDRCQFHIVLWVLLTGSLFGMCVSTLASSETEHTAAFQPQPADNIVVALTLDAAVRAAVSWHPSIAEAAARLQQQSSHIAAARSQYYPQINAGLNGGYDSSQDNNRYQQSAVLSVSQVLYDFGKTASSVRSEQAGFIRVQADLLMAIDKLVQQTAQAVMEVQRYQQLVAIAEAQRMGIEQLAGLVDARHSKGAGNRSDVVQSQSRIEASRALQLQYQTQLARWQSRLASQMGVLSVATVADDFSVIHTGICNAQTLDADRVPAVVQARALRNQAEAQLDQADARKLPSLTLEPSVRYYLSDPPYSGSVQEERNRYEVHLNFDMPLYRGGSLRAQQQAARHALTSADAAMQNALLETRQNMAEASSQQAHQQYHLQVLLQREKLSTETRDLYRQQYLELGNRSLLDLLNAEQDIYQSRIDRQNLLSDQNQLLLTCAAISGRLRELFDLSGHIQGVELVP